MKNIRYIFLTLILIPALPGFSQNKTTTNLKDAYRFESNHAQIFTAYAGQADKEGLPKVATFFRAVAKTASVHADNFQKVISQAGITVTSSVPAVNLQTSQLNVEEALKDIRIQSGITYAAYLDQAKNDNETNATKALRWAKETEQKSLQDFIDVDDAIVRAKTGSLPAFYWVCPKCGNLYNVAVPENECSFCYTEREKFVKVQ